MSIDKRVRGAVQQKLDEINDETLTRFFVTDKFFAHPYLTTHDIFTDKAEQLKKLFPKNYELFKAYHETHRRHSTYTIWYLEEMLFIEYAGIDFSDWAFLDEYFTPFTDGYQTQGVSAFMVQAMHRDPDEILQKFKAYPRAGHVLVPAVLAAATDGDGKLKSEAAADGLIEFVKNAGLQDSLRYTIFNAFLGTDDLATLAYFVNVVEQFKLTRFKSLKESMVHADIEYQLKFTSDEYIKIMRSVVDGDYDKFLNGKNGTYRLLTVHTLLKYRKSEFGEIAKKYISSGNEIIRRSFLYIIGMFDRYSQNTGLYYDIVTDNEFTMPEYAAFFHCFAYDGRKGLGAKMFDLILRIFDGMSKATFSVPSTDDFPITTNVTKDELACILIGIAQNTGDPGELAEIEKRYDSLPVYSQGNFVLKLGDKTKLDKRKLVIEFLRTDSCGTAYKEAKIKLTYDEAVHVSDFLKSKKQDVKNTILKEFLRSPDKQKICEYLCSCKEQYKREIGEEMQTTLNGKINDKALDEPRGSYEERRQNNSVIALTRPDITFPEYKKRPLEQIDSKRIEFIFDEILKFIERNKDYEYKPAFDSTLVTIGSMFKPFEYTFTFSGYPLGEQLEEIFKKLSYVEIIELSLLSNAYIKHPEYYEKSHGKGNALSVFGKLSQKYPVVEAMYLYALLPIALKQFADSDTAFEYVKQLCFFGAFSDKDNSPFQLLTAAMQTDKDENIKALIYLSDKDINPKYKVDIDTTLGSVLFAKAYERGLLSGEYIKYRLAKCTTIAHCLTNRDDKNEYYMYSEGFKYPKFREFYKALIDEIVDAELNRGTLNTPYTDTVRRLAEIYGAEIFVKAIVKARGLTLVRNNCDYWGSQKDELISKILKTVRPAETDDFQTFSALVDKYKVKGDELVRAAVYNLNFLNLISERLNVAGFKSAVLYFAAHLNENLDEARIEKIKEYSTIDYHDFKDGALDFDWYADMIKTIPERDFKRIYDNAKYITVAGLHKRAQRFFDALNGKITAAEAKARILESRNKDFCLIYSLIPLKDEADLIERYKFFADFLKQSKKYGAQRQMSERRTVDIAFDNLARNAGYADSSVFIYEMESRDRRVIDMYEGVEINGYTLKLDYVNDKIKLTVTDKNGKKLASTPAAIAKSEQATEIAEYKKSEEAKRKRLKRSLEEAMENQTPFTAEQILNITAQPLIRTFFERLILTDGNAAYVLIDGAITDIQTGKQAASKSFTIAHPVTLKSGGTLRAAIKYVIAHNIKQPFKQVLREMYIMSDGEKDAQEILRYKGFNVDLKKAVAALKSRGWGVSEDVGLRKVYYKSRTIAAIFREFDYYYIYDFGNVNRELESIIFIDRNDYTIKQPKSVDPIVFSETLRDVDLMIAISANSTYDYELSMSTFEMRRAIIQSITEILGIKNVTFLKENVKVDGTLGTYVINIRTGLVFKEGKGNLLLKTIDGYDKPIALDFIDEDPMTADIVTKALILAGDDKIKDPAILSEIAG